MSTLRKGKKVSKNFIIKKRIHNPVELLELRTVYVKSWDKMHPTAFLCSMPFIVLNRFMSRGIYECDRINN